MPLPPTKTRFPLLLALLFTSRHAFALTDTWIGPDQGLWSDRPTGLAALQIRLPISK